MLTTPQVVVCIVCIIFSVLAILINWWMCSKVLRALEDVKSRVEDHDRTMHKWLDAFPEPGDHITDLRDYVAMMTKKGRIDGGANPS